MIKSVGDAQASLDRLFDKILPPDYNREAELWPAIYDYRAAVETKAEQALIHVIIEYLEEL